MRERGRGSGLADRSAWIGLRLAEEQSQRWVTSQGAPREERGCSSHPERGGTGVLALGGCCRDSGEARELSTASLQQRKVASFKRRALLSHAFTLRRLRSFVGAAAPRRAEL